MNNLTQTSPIQTTTSQNGIPKVQSATTAYLVQQQLHLYMNSSQSTTTLIYTNLSKINKVYIQTYIEHVISSSTT